MVESIQNKIAENNDPRQTTMDSGAGRYPV
jgi:hypothetical protein